MGVIDYCPIIFTGSQGHEVSVLGQNASMKRTVVSTPNAPAAIGPYSQAIRAGDMLFMSGQIPLKPDGTLVKGSIKEQTEQAIENMKAVLASQGLTMDNIVKTNIFLSSMDHFAEMNEVYATAFTAEPPARSTVAVAGLPKGVDVEIEAIAVFS
jgi:2-iminobutanoate/2-iminopropanoate deaminase